MSESRLEYQIERTRRLGEPDPAPAPIVVGFGDWRYNVLLRLDQLARVGRMIIIDADARCWYEVGRLECNKEDRRLPPEM